MATIEETNNSMTIFFSKSTGNILAFSSGVQDMAYFGDNQTDYEQICECVVLPRDNFVVNNLSQFKINVSTKTLELIAGSAITDYPVASS